MCNRTRDLFVLMSCFLLIPALQLPEQLAADETTSLKPIRIVLVGDSTVSDYPNSPADRPDMTGWGQVFHGFFNNQVKVFNHAAGGRSSKSFLREGRWQKALADKPDYVFIQFGHNDCPGKGDRTTDPATDYRGFLQQYIQESRSAGATPVLVTPVARRTFQNDSLTDTLAPYAEAMEIVGRENDVPVIPLHKLSSDLYHTLGDAGSADLTASPGDRTHFSRKGALTMAHLVTAQLPRLLPEISSYLKSEESQAEANLK